MKNLLWIDIETTGLNERTGKILEIAVAITDEKLIMTKSRDFVIYQDVDNPDVCPMDDFVVGIHTDNGLLDAVRKSSLFQYRAERDLNGWLSRELTNAKGEVEVFPLGGSNPEFDRRWVVHHMPSLERFFSYRSFDMNTLYMLFDVDKNKAMKSRKHRAMTCIMGDINTLREIRNRYLPDFVGFDVDMVRRSEALFKRRELDLGLSEIVTDLRKKISK